MALMWKGAANRSPEQRSEGQGLVGCWSVFIISLMKAPTTGTAPYYLSDPPSPLLWPHWNPGCSLHTTGTLLPQGLCTGYASTCNSFLQKSSWLISSPPSSLCLHLISPSQKRTSLPTPESCNILHTHVLLLALTSSHFSFHGIYSCLLSKAILRPILFIMHLSPTGI